MTVAGVIDLTDAEVELVVRDRAPTAGLLKLDRGCRLRCSCVGVGKLLLLLLLLLAVAVGGVHVLGFVHALLLLLLLLDKGEVATLGVLKNPGK